MKKVYELFDRYSEMIPPVILRFVRLGAILVWLIAATIVVYYSWQSGRFAAPQVGQSLDRADLEEKATIERNLERASEVRVPALHELLPERDELRIPDDSLPTPGSRGSIAPERRYAAESLEAEPFFPPFRGEGEPSIFPARERIEPATERQLPPVEVESMPSRIDGSRFEGTAPRSEGLGLLPID